MENLENKTDAELIAELKTAHCSEVESVIRCLRRLHEIDKRGIALDRGFSSVNEFARKELQFSKDEAYPRVRAAEVFALDPVFENYMREFKISVTGLMAAQVTFISEAKRRKLAQLPLLSVAERIAVVKKIANESVKDARRVLAECFPDLRQDCEETKPIKDGRTQIKCSFSEATIAKIDRIKDLSARKNFDRKWEPFFEMIIDDWLKHNDPAMKTTRAKAPKAEAPEKEPAHEEQAEFDFQDHVVSKRRNDKPIPARLQRLAKERAEYKCQWVDHETGRRCISTHGIDTDHIISRAMGGTNELDNLRILCSAHNKHAARRAGLKQKRRQADGSLKFEYPSFRNDGQAPLSNWN